MNTVPRPCQDARLLPELPAGGLDDCQGEATKFLGAYWQRKCTALGRMPRLADIDLMDLYKIAANMAIRDVIDGGQDFKNRYWGSVLTAKVGFEGTNRRFSDYPLSPLRDRITMRLRRVVETGQPFVKRGRLELVPNRDHVQFELLHVPLAAEFGPAVCHVMTVFDFAVRVNVPRDVPTEMFAARGR